MSHTPGPWTAETHTAYRLAGPVGPMFQIEAGPQSPYWIAYVQDTPEGRDNARLIAAAPELLEAAKSLLEEHNCDDGTPEYKGTATSCGVCTPVRAAIAKATGDPA